MWRGDRAPREGGSYSGRVCHSLRQASGTAARRSLSGRIYAIAALVRLKLGTRTTPAQTPVQPQPETELAQLSRRYRPALMSYFLRRVHGHAEAEDLTQEVFVRLTTVAPARMRSVEAYLFQVAANLLRDRSRREKVRFDYAAAQLALEDAGVEPLDPPRVVAGRRSVAALAARLRELPERTRAMFVLYRIENMSKRDIAEAYGVCQSTVEKQVGKAMAYLMQCREDGE